MLNKNINELNNGNKIIGYYPQMISSNINFHGENNILYCGENVRLRDTDITFKGSNSIVFLNSSKYDYKLGLKIYNDSVFHMGRDNYINQKMRCVISERKHCFIGDNGIFSFGVWIRNMDTHLIYSCETGKRVNLTRSVFIGDHVWIGQNVTILKGAQIDSGSIIGAMSVVAGKRIPHNSLWAGNPCRQIGENVFWDGSSVYDWGEDETESSLLYSDFIAQNKNECHEDYWIYHFDKKECIDFSELDVRLSEKAGGLEKCEYLMLLGEKKDKNRFVH